MKKKILFTIMAVAAVTFGAKASDEYTHDTSVLPEAALSTIRNNYKSKISVIKVDKDFGRVSDYEVVLTDGSEIKFDRKGNWRDVESSATSAVPSGFVPDAIKAYVKTQQPKSRIIGLEKDRKGYEVALSNGIEMKFDTQGNFLRYD